MTETNSKLQSQDDLSHLNKIIRFNAPAKGQVTFTTPFSAAAAVAVGNPVIGESRYTLFDEETIDAMSRYNASHPELSLSEKFNLVDARILSLICFCMSEDRVFNLSNKDLAHLCLVTEPTIQKSINKLLDHGLVSKSLKSVFGSKQRILTCNNDALQRFKSPTAS